MSNLKPLKDRIPKSTIAMGEDYFNQKYKMQARALENKRKEVKWIFDSIDLSNS